MQNNIVHIHVFDLYISIISTVFISKGIILLKVSKKGFYIIEQKESES